MPHLEKYQQYMQASLSTSCGMLFQGYDIFYHMLSMLFSISEAYVHRPPDFLLLDCESSVYAYTLNCRSCDSSTVMAKPSSLSSEVLVPLLWINESNRVKGLACTLVGCLFNALPCTAGEFNTLFVWCGVCIGSCCRHKRHSKVEDSRCICLTFQIY